jgi:23S rRNA pseudouridine2605 synthase
MGRENFQKFITQHNNAAIKEKIKQEKKIAKKLREEAINNFYEQKRANRFNLVNTEAKTQSGKSKTGNGIKASRNKTKSLKTVSKSDVQITNEAKMPLNKFLAHCGVASRRATVELIKGGKVSVNKEIITQPAFKVGDTDQVFLNGKRLFVTRNLVYILLNKPKDYITTTDDPQKRKTVLQLIKNATNQRVYPVGRLDRNTSGVLVLTNDGQLTQMLTHPSYNIKKVYEVTLNKPLTKHDYDKILNGIMLDDGPIAVDALAYADTKNKSVIGIELHSGRNRIVRRIFEYLGYEIRNLDRVMYGNLTKKNVERGKWRYLNEREVRFLKYLGGGKNKLKIQQENSIDDFNPKN